MPVRVRRFGGWSTPVEVWVENLPPSVTSEKMTAEPKDTIVKDNCALDRQLDGTNVYIPMHVAADAPAGDYPIRLHARGVMDGKVVERTAEILYWWEHVGKVTGAVEEQKLVATVTDLPAVVFEPPESVSIAPGKVARLQFLVQALRRWQVHLEDRAGNAHRRRQVRKQRSAAGQAERRAEADGVRPVQARMVQAARRLVSFSAH